MVWIIEYLPQVREDLKVLGKAEATRVLSAIDSRVKNGEPDKLGTALRGSLSGCRRIRVGNTRIVYRVDSHSIRVLIVAVGMRRDSEVYTLAEKRREQIN